MFTMVNFMLCIFCPNKNTCRDLGRCCHIAWVWKVFTCYYTNQKKKQKVKKGLGCALRVDWTVGKGRTSAFLSHSRVGSGMREVLWHSAISEGWSVAVSHRCVVTISHLFWAPTIPWPDSTWEKMLWETQELEFYVEKQRIHNVTCRNWGKSSWVSQQ